MRKVYKNVYFIGIGGIGMSAIARYYKFHGAQVSGYDRTESPLTKELEAEGIHVHYTDDTSFIPKDTDNTLIVYTPAIPSDMGELVFAQSNGYKLLKRSMILGEITKGQKCLAVAGTHGKTTTSTLVAHILNEGTKGCNAFLGGISKNYNTNLLTSSSRIVVAEADEYDRSFLQLHPAIAAITAIDADHLDIYGDLKHVQEAFCEFASQVSETIILKYGYKLKPVQAKIFTYHLNDPKADCHASNIRLGDDNLYTYDLVYPGGTLNDIKVGVPGLVNIENSIAAALICLCCGVDAQKVRRSIGTFQGVKRRLDMHVNKPGLCYLDDYAHHPEELSHAIQSIRKVLPGRKITAVFQPHLYTRTRDFADAFAKALSSVDKLILLDIYPARELPIPGVTSQIIFENVKCKEKILLEKNQLMETLEKEPLDVLVTLGAGDIDRFIGPITEMLEKR